MYNWKDTRNYRRFRDENGNVIANIIYVDGEEVAVSDEVYEAYASMDRRERYLEERDNDDKPLSVDALLEEGYDRRYHQQWPAQNSRGAGGTVQDRHAHFSSGAGTGRPARRRGKAPCPAAGAQRKIRRKALHPCEAENAVRSRHQICEERPETERGKGAVT